MLHTSIWINSKRLWLLCLKLNDKVWTNAKLNSHENTSNKGQQLLSHLWKFPQCQWWQWTQQQLLAPMLSSQSIDIHLESLACTSQRKHSMQQTCKLVLAWQVWRLPSGWSCTRCRCSSIANSYKVPSLGTCYAYSCSIIHVHCWDIQAFQNSLLHNWLHMMVAWQLFTRDSPEVLDRIASQNDNSDLVLMPCLHTIVRWQLALVMFWPFVALCVSWCSGHFVPLQHSTCSSAQDHVVVTKIQSLLSLVMSSSSILDGNDLHQANNMVTLWGWDHVVDQMKGPLNDLKMFTHTC